MLINQFASAAVSVTEKPFANLAELDGSNENLNLQIGRHGSQEQFTGTQWSEGQEAQRR